MQSLKIAQFISVLQFVNYVGASSYLVVAGGHDGKEFIASAETFQPRFESWQLMESMTDSRGHFASCVLNDKLWALGGWDPYNRGRMLREGRDSKALKSTEFFDPTENHWIRGVDMVDHRAFHKAAVLDGQIYVVGGFNGLRDLDLVDRLDISKGEWVREHALRSPRSGLGVGAVRGRLFVMGGHNHLDPLGSVESLDPREGVWREEPEMLYHRGYPATTCAGDCLFVAGGSFGNNLLGTAEMFDARRGKWTMLPSMTVRRNGAALALMEDLLVVVGGFDGRDSCLKVVEFLDLSKDLMEGQWEAMPEMMSYRDGPCLEVLSTPIFGLTAKRMRALPPPPPERHFLPAADDDDE